MTDTYDKILSDIKEAMFDKNTVKRDCLRAIVSEVKNQTVNAGKELTEDVVIKVLQKSVKQHADSIESFKAGKREDLALKESEELSYLQPYLPKALSEAETMSILSTLLASIEPVKKNMGIIMKQLPKEVDKKLASKLLASMLH